MHGVDFFDASVGVAVGSNGTLLRTSDAGETWERVPLPAAAAVDLLDVDLVDARTGYAIGDEGTAFRTDDQGRAWEPLATPTGHRLSGAFFFSPDSGFLVGEHGTLLRTRDGGRSWTRDSLAPGPLRGIDFMDRRTGHIVGGTRDSALVLTTRDGGDTWTTQVYVAPPLKRVARGMAAGDNSLDLIAGSGMTMGQGGLNSIRFRDDFGCAVGSESINWTRDGGRTWTTRRLATPFALNDGRMLDSLSILAVGEGGTLRRSPDGGRTWAVTSDRDRVSLTALQSLGGDTAFALEGGFPTRLRKTTDGWKTWDVIAPRASGGIRSFHFPNPRIGYASSDSLLISHDGGLSWGVVGWGPALSGHEIGSLRFLGSGDTGFLAAHQQVERISRIFKTADAGATWRPVLEIPMADAIAEFSFPSSRTGFAWAQNAGLRRTDDGGETWYPLPYPEGPRLDQAFHFMTESAGFTFESGFAPAFMKTTDGGMTWQSRPFPAGPGEYVSAIQFLDLRVGYIALNGLPPHERGRVLITRDGGSTWEPAHSGGTPPLHALHVTPAGKILAAGRWGTLVEIPGQGYSRVRRTRPTLNAGGKPPGLNLRGGTLRTPSGRNVLGRKPPFP